MDTTIENGDFVKVVGKCHKTSMRFKVVKGMKKYINNPVAYQVSIPTSLLQTNCVFIHGFKWDIADLRLVRKKDGTIIDEFSVEPKSDEKIDPFFKFDEKLLDI